MKLPFQWWFARNSCCSSVIRYGKRAKGGQTMAGKLSPFQLKKKRTLDLPHFAREINTLWLVEGFRTWMV